MEIAILLKFECWIKNSEKADLFEKTIKTLPSFDGLKRKIHQDGSSTFDYILRCKVNIQMPPELQVFSPRLHDIDLDYLNVYKKS